MRIHDVTVPIRPGMPVWPGDPQVELYRKAKLEDGKNANVSFLSLSVHTGTHVDAPFHFLSDGIPVDQLSLEVLVGLAEVVELPEEVQEINAEIVNSLDIISSVDRILFKTSNSAIWNDPSNKFYIDFVGITADGAKALVKKGFRLVGIDYLSIAPFKRSKETHETLLKAKMVVIEGLDLREINPGIYTLICLPIKLTGADGAPARVVLIEE